MKTLLEGVEEARRQLQAHPELQRMGEMRKVATRLEGALEAFLQEAQVALLTLEPEYIELTRFLQDGAWKPEHVKAACEALSLGEVPSGRDAWHWLAVRATEKGLARQLLSTLGKSPEEQLQVEFRELAYLDEDKRPKAFRRWLKQQKKTQVRAVLGFKIVEKKGKDGKRKLDAEQTWLNALEVLQPYIDKMKAVG
ncbi:MAG: hypothetical protein AAF555_06500 [Verrucomicrobiota bacterium]